jgi:hypothetical protein
MTKEEIDLLSKIVVACKGALGMQAGVIPQMREECWRQINELEKAFNTVQEANKK